MALLSPIGTRSHVMRCLQIPFYLNKNILSSPTYSREKKIERVCVIGVVGETGRGDGGGESVIPVPACDFNSGTFSQEVLNVRLKKRF